MQIHQLSLGTVLSLAYSDGSIEFRNRSLEPIAFDDGLDTVSGLAQTGFSFQDQEPCKSIYEGLTDSRLYSLPRRVCCSYL